MAFNPGEAIGMVRRKQRDVESELRQAGCRPLSSRGKGSHVRWLHDASGMKVSLPRPKGDLLPGYVDKQVKDAILEALSE
jgi:predicted RNA binding protein YcfA (HicA-like mRNA interferase family)